MPNERLKAIKEMQDMAYNLRCNILEIKMDSDIKDQVSEILETFELELYHMEDKEKKRIDDELNSILEDQREGYQMENR